MLRQAAAGSINTSVRRPSLHVWRPGSGNPDNPAARRVRVLPELPALPVHPGVNAQVESRAYTARFHRSLSLMSFSGLVGRAICRHRLDWRTGAMADQTGQGIAVVNVLNIDTGRRTFLIISENSQRLSSRAWGCCRLSYLHTGVQTLPDRRRTRHTAPVRRTG